MLFRSDKGREELHNQEGARSIQLASMLENLSEDELRTVDAFIPVIDTILERYSEDDESATPADPAK